MAQADVSSKNDLHDVFLFLTVVDCGNLTDPANGTVNDTDRTFGQTATYSCDTGYSLVGDRTRTCQASGSWSGSAPTCQGTFIIKTHSHPVGVASGLLVKALDCGSKGLEFQSHLQQRFISQRFISLPCALSPTPKIE